MELADYATEQSEDFHLVARPLPNVMPVIMWGASPEETARLKEIGFTHCLGLNVDAGDIWSEKKVLPPGKPELIDKNRRMLDEALANDLGVIASLSPGNMLENNAAYLRIFEDALGGPALRADVEYRGQAGPGDMLRLRSWPHPAGRAFALQRGDDVLCRAVLQP